MEVDTGDYVPDDYDAVIMIEDVNFENDRARIIQPAVPWQHIRSIGEDMVAQDLLLPSYTRIGPYELASLITAGEGPYGKPFPAVVTNTFLISGGAGIAPICFLAEKLTEQNLPFTWLHGESKAENLTLLDYLPVKPNKVSVEPTLVTDLLPKEAQFYCACGPKPMLKGLHSKWGTNGFVSLEERMSCGFGACYGCVIPPHLDTKGFVKKDRLRGR